MVENTKQMKERGRHTGAIKKKMYQGQEFDSPEGGKATPCGDRRKIKARRYKGRKMQRLEGLETGAKLRKREARLHQEWERRRVLDKSTGTSWRAHGGGGIYALSSERMSFWRYAQGSHRDSRKRRTGKVNGTNLSELRTGHKGQISGLRTGKTSPN